MSLMICSNMALLLIFGLFVVIASGHNITFLEVPQYGDPRHSADLVCHYVNEQDDPPLHSVKWYRDNNEVFRFTPGQQVILDTTGVQGLMIPMQMRIVSDANYSSIHYNVPPTRTFNTTSGTVTRGSCNMHSCMISVVLPRRFNKQISFTCEVSTEGPRFAVVKQTKLLSIAVALKQDPIITGLPGSVQRGEDIVVNCSTGPAMPPANIVWYIDDKPDRREPWLLNNTEVSAPDADGLRSSWRPLQLKVTSHKNHISIRCEATQPTNPPFLRAANATVIIAQTPHLSMFMASRCNTINPEFVVCMSTFIIIYKLFRTSAFCGVY